MSLLNENGLHSITLRGKEEKVVHFEQIIDVSNIENHMQNGSFSKVNLIIKNGDKKRRL